jgi:hypothetical protein
MGLFGPFIFKNKKGKKFWLHIKIKGKSKIYYFSKDPRGALRDIPKGYQVFEEPKTGLPFLKKGSSGFLGILGGKGKVKKDKKPQKKVEEKPKKI